MVKERRILAKKCRFCGAEMDDNAIKCPECEKLVPNAEIILDKQKQAKKKRNNIILISVISVILIVIVLVISNIQKNNSTGANSYIDAIDMNLSSMVNNEPKKYLNSYPEFIRDELEQTLGLLSDGNFEEYFDSMHDEIYKIYGSNISVSYEMLTKTHMSQDDIDQYVDDLKSYFQVENSDVDYNIQDAYQLGISITINGTTGNQTLNKSIAVMKIDGSWYVMNIINIAMVQVDNQQGG